MTLEELKSQQQKEWEDFYEQRQQTQAQLWHVENDLVEALDMEQDRVPASIRERLDKDWKQFEQEWGLEGDRYKSLQHKHRKELSVHYKTDPKVSKLLSDFEDAKEDITSEPYLYENQTGRHKEWAELQHDHRAIEDYYQSLGKDIPKPTQYRMKRQVADYQKNHKLPVTGDAEANLSDKDLILFRSAHDIYEADFAISLSYETVPDSTNERLRDDLREFFSMNEAYHAYKQDKSFTGKLVSKYQQMREKYWQKDDDPRRLAFRQRMQESNNVNKSREQDFEQE